MVFAARALKNVSGVNSWLPASSPTLVPGSEELLYIQLLDLEALTASCPQRYVPATGATLEVTIRNLDDAAQIVRLATQPFPGDQSIWALQLLATDELAGALDILLTLTEGSRIRTGKVMGVARVECRC